MRRYAEPKFPNRSHMHSQQHSTALSVVTIPQLYHTAPPPAFPNPVNTSSCDSGKPVLQFLLEPFWNPTGTQREPTKNAGDDDREDDGGGSGDACDV